MNELGIKHHVLTIDNATFSKAITLNEATYSIGRHSSNNIVLNSQKVSRNHATLLRRTDVKNNSYSYWILDGDLQGNRSRNGIIINEKKCLVHELKHGDVIKFSADLKAKYQITDDDSGILKNSGNSILESSRATGSEDYSKQTLINKETLIASEDEIPNQVEKLDNAELIRLTSVADLSPQSIIEIDLHGNITFLNSQALNSFKNLTRKREEHPLLEELTSKVTAEQDILVRELKINNQYFRQTSHYLPENKLIRSYIENITDYKSIEGKLFIKNSLYKTIAQKNTEGIILVDYGSKRILEVNEAVCDILDYSQEELTSISIDNLIFDKSGILKNLSDIVAKETLFVEEYCLCKKNRDIVTVSLYIQAIEHQDEPTILLLIINENNSNEQDLQESNNVFAVVPKPIKFLEQLNDAIKNAANHDKLLAVISIKINEFPVIKNSLNIELSNLLLASFSERIKSALSSGDTLVHWEEDNFIILMPTITAIEEAAKVSIRILDSLAQDFKLKAHQLHINVKMGISIYPQDGDNIELLLKNADIALSRIKNTSDLSYQFYSENMNSQAMVQLKLEHFLHQALEKEEFVLYYQPQVDVNNGNIQGIEALLRWQHPELGLVSPSSFLTIAEQTGLIISIGEWVIRTACRQNKQWHVEGLPPLKISVNLSPLQFKQPNLPLVIKEILDETQLEPQLLELEISASTVMQDIEYSRGILSQLQDIGLHISIDDFATGFASLERLRKIPFDTLKLDRGFIQNLTNNPQDLAIVSAMVVLGKGFNLRIVAEGVETEEQIEILRSQECIQMQGFWFSRPLAAEEVTKLLPFTKGNTELLPSHRENSEQ
ncbi:diguanylate cyclase (GGDEF) domain-containing protein [Xenococcus sp. PCC 7305]|uniref:EAL domain-containing protein n=1 Tax=Xenococcus sp. PCC 7305 TaxID=102125 RepID=UPI0002ACE879|nr:EAL domain-containing protein [Xenococcus sp. PCC 7305]ELS01433.1 diguanylate cyclase (GGDEF) domain-containing protein [Xenococcus sp. PCC 7305]